MENPTLTVYGNVGVVTGDVRHPGDVRIFGSILPGHRVEAGGNLVVTRDVRGSEVLAGGDLTINGVVWEEGTVLDAVGSIRLRQVADTRIIAGLDVFVRAVAERCEVLAGRRVTFSGVPGGIHGGEIHAGIAVEARRIAKSGGEPARITIGTSPFEETEEDLERRLGFARKRADADQGKAGSPQAFRRQIAGEKTYANLVETVKRRLRQLRNASGVVGSPCLRVNGQGAIWAEVTLGEVEAALVYAPERLTGSFEAVLSGEEVKVRTLGETACVG